MTTAMTSGVYIHVIEDVVNKVREEFVSGPGENILDELQGLWEMKMMQCGAILGPIERSSAPRPTPGGTVTPFHDLNVPYEGTDEYETPTADLLFPPTPLQTPMQTPLPGSGQTPLPGTAQTPLPGTADSSPYNISTGGTPITPAEYSTDNGGASEAKSGRPSQFMQAPAPWLNQRPHLDVNIAYDGGHDQMDRGASQQPTTKDFLMMSTGKRKREDLPSHYRNGYIPQQDGAGDNISDELKEGEGTISAKQEFTKELELSYIIPQVDGPLPSPYDDALSTPNIYNYQEVVNEDYNIVNTPAPNDLQAATPAIVTQKDTVDDEDDEPLNENDDDDDFDGVGEGEDLNTSNLVLAQFDKVTRTKSRWKCTLKDGIMHLNDRDILFNKANGEFDF